MANRFTSLFWLAAIILTPIGLINLYLKLTLKWCKSKTCLIGKTVIITGANTGIGYEIALNMAMRGARVILACRDKNRGEEAKKRIIAQSGNSNIVVKILDLASFKSVREFARDINENEECLHILIHNAGAFIQKDGKSEDGLLLVMQVNYYSNFLLTHLLIDLMKKSAPSRVISTSSLAAKYTLNFDITNINKGTNKYSYPNSKLCNIIFTRALAQRLKDTQVTAYSVNPGMVKTELDRNLQGCFKYTMKLLINLFFVNPELGAQTTIYTAVAKDIENWSGENFANCAREEPYYSKIKPGYENKLWNQTIDLIKMKPEEINI